MPAGKTYENIGQTTTLGSNVLSFTFSNISQDYTDLIIVGTVKSNVTGAAASFRVNNLTTSASYTHAWMTRSNNTTYSGIDSGQTYIPFDWYTTPGTTDGFMFVSEILNYTGTHHNKTIFTRAISVGSDSTYQGNDVIAGNIATTSPITSIKISMQESATTYLNSGSTFTLYGIKAA